MAFGKIAKFHLSRKCIGFLLLYVIIIFFIVSYYITSNLHPKVDNCKLPNTDLFERENDLGNKIETSIQHFLANCFHSDNFQTNKIWTQVSKDIYIYSAYFDYCPSIHAFPSVFCVKLIGISLSNLSSSISTSNVKCSFKSGHSVLNMGYAMIEKLPEDHSKVYSAAYFYCPFGNYSKFLWPGHVTLVDSSAQLLWIPVQNIVGNVNRNLSISLCVRPFYGSFSAVSLIEFLSFYSTMGVDHFIFYHYKVSNYMKKFLNFLPQTNISMELLYWDIPLSNDFIHEYGQIVFTADCITRSKYKFTHTLLVDIDEYIVPKFHQNIKNLLLYLDMLNENAGSYMVSMVLFCDEYASKISEISPFKVLNRNKRQKTYWQYQFRSKYIVKPDKVHSGGIHFVWKHESNSYEILLPPSLALLHHYRSCCGMQQTWFFHLFKFYVLNDETVIDNTLASHKQEILSHHLIQFIFNSLSCTTISL